MTIVNEYIVKNSLNQTKLNLKNENEIKTDFNRNVAEYFDYIYSYPPKIQVKWDSIDDLNEDLFIGSDYETIGSSVPLSNLSENWFFTETKGEAIPENYSFSKYVNSFLDKFNSSTFFSKKTKKIQAALSNIPIFVVLNGQGEVVLSKPANFLGPNSFTNYLNEKIYDSCGAFDVSIEKKSGLGLFFMNRSDAENYLKEIAIADFEGAKTVGLSIHCVNLSTAYKITREYHPGIDFRFVPDIKEVKDLLIKKVGKSDMMVEDEQQQLRFRHRSNNLFPYLKKLGNFLSPSSSFLQRNEYFKGVPIYIVQLKENPRNFFTEVYFNVVGSIDNLYNGCVQFLDSTVGFGHNWIIQGSLQKAGCTDKFENYIFFEKEQALQFSKTHGRYVSRYIGGRSSNLEFAIRKPKILIYNLEDLLEDWEDQLWNEQNDNAAIMPVFFKAKTNKFISPSLKADESLNLNQESQIFAQTNVKKLTQILNVKFRVLKRTIGIFFSLNA